MTEQHQLHRYCFAVSSAPYAVFQWDMPAENLRFIRGIDPSYWEYMAKTHGGTIPEGEEQRAAVAIRTVYAQGLESLFSLLFAGLQAPGCIVAWLIKYKRSHLVELVEAI